MAASVGAEDRPTRPTSLPSHHSTRKPGPIRFKTTFRNTIYTAFTERGWRMTEGNDWDIHWADRDWIYEVFDTVHLESWQRVNHFRNDRELCRKDLLVKNLKKFKRGLSKSNPEEAERYDFWPTTYVLPGDYALFAEEFKRNPNSTWIMKPVGRSQGKGIFIFTKLNQISKWKSDSRYSKSEGNEAEAYVVQKYIFNPYLVGGKKFDLRIYALVTSFSPLTVWLYRSGFCRFSAARYSTASADLENTVMHLTNVAIQKKGDTYDSSSGQKWDVYHLKLYLMSRYGVEVVDRLFTEIQMIVLRALFSVQQVMIQDKHCFELYGYDVLFDDTFKPWLVEVNASPSLTASTAEDSELKVKMLSSMLDILDLDGDGQLYEQIGGFDLIYRNGFIEEESEGIYHSKLGAEVPEGSIRVPLRESKSSVSTAAPTKSSEATTKEIPGSRGRS